MGQDSQASVLPWWRSARDSARLREWVSIRHAPDMASQDHQMRFGAGLTEAEIRRFQTIVREQYGVDLPLPEAWSRAIPLLSLVEMLLSLRGVLVQQREQSTGFALPPS